MTNVEAIPNLVELVKDEALHTIQWSEPEAELPDGLCLMPNLAELLVVLAEGQTCKNGCMVLYIYYKLCLANTCYMVW